MRKILIIYNKTAGNQTGIESVKKFIKRLEDENIEYTLEKSNSIDEIKYAYPNKKNVDYTDVVMCGGDGTINKTVNVFHDRDVVFGVIPIGSGNDFIKTAYGKTENEDMIEKIIKREVQEIDLIKANDMYFINALGMGIDSQTMMYQPYFNKHLNPKTAYRIAAFLALLTYRPKTAKIYIDDELLNLKTHIIIVANGKYIGGGMKISPESEMCDGKFEIMMLKKTDFFSLINVFMKLFKGKHLDNKNVIYKSAKSVSISMDNQCFQAEGDLSGWTPLKISYDKKIKFIK
ncbi:MAG: hypothetical protein CSB16_00285 [Clostridiales bacterium]|nr:MAG: hypothetical protein CSB16_00285 [Clostridiales bacterium]